MKAEPTRSPPSSSVPPVLDGHHPPVPEPLEWQKHLPAAADADASRRIPRGRPAKKQGER
ncbi:MULTISPECIES: hypothetical protein [Rhodanobacter]|nr:hypothetical protein [Rhodanobacter spathiphylli]